MTDLTFRSFRLQLKDTFTLSHGSYEYRDTAIIELTRNGVSGLGEATVIPYLGISLKKLKSAFDRVLPSVKNCEWQHPLELWDSLASLLKNDSFLLSAIDCAAWDWYGKKKGQPVYKLLDLNPSSIPLTSYTIGRDTEEVMIRKMNAQPWPIYKIKISSRADLALIQNLRKVSDSVFRIDANCSWEKDSLYTDYEKLADLNIDLLEQPLPMGQEIYQDKSKHRNDLPIIADESCSVPEDVEKCAPWFDGVNVKLMKCGGITPAIKMIAKARDNGLKIMGGCMTESSIGITAMAHISPHFDYLDLDGAMLLSNDPATGVHIADGKVYIPDSPGLGCQLK